MFILAENHLELCPIGLAEVEQSSVFDSNLSTLPGGPFDKVTMFSELSAHQVRVGRVSCNGASEPEQVSPIPPHHHYKEDSQVL